MTPWQRLLKELFGEDADQALDQLRDLGMDPTSMAAAAGMANNPAMFDHVMSQIRKLVKGSAGEDVNWNLAHDVARGVAAQGGDPTVTAADASTHRAAVSRAELWLDAVTDFDPSRLEPRVWSRAEWVEGTMPAWRTIAGPVAVSVSHALSDVLRGEVDGGLGGLGGDDEDAGSFGSSSSERAGGRGIDPAGLIRSVSPTVCGMHMGQAAGEMAREAFGGTDLGLPLLKEPRVVLIPSAIAAFASGLDVDEDQVLSFLALREAAHVRLFQAAPWLPGQLLNLVTRYASGITIDLEALEQAVRDAGMGDPGKLQKALNRGIFAAPHTQEQTTLLESIETLLALVEGWVDDVTLRAAAAHVPEVGALREMMRRRRAAGGPAEDAFANLLSLELRPRRMRDAASLWAALAARLGPEGRDELWSHPDLLPTSEQLGGWEAWVEGYVNRGEGDEVDRELERLLGGLDGTD